MRKLNYIFLFIVGMFLLNSCLESESSFDLNDQEKNLAGFETGTGSAAAISDGREYKFTVKVKIVGPTKVDLKNDITLTIGADASSTAVEGVHFRIDNPTVTLKADNNYLGLFEYTMLTEGIDPPLDKAPVLVLKVVDASGEEMVVNSGKMTQISLLYACYSNLSGDYSVSVTRTNYDGVVTTYPSYTETISETGIGQYRTGFVGHYIPTNGFPDGLGVGDPGFTFNDNCGTLSVPLQTLNNYYSNEVVGTDLGLADENTGVLTLKYQISFAAGIRSYVSVYTPVP
jgi:hypothetical protein